MPALFLEGLDRCKLLASEDRDEELLATRAKLNELGVKPINPTRNKRIAWVLLHHSIPLFKIACKRKCQRQGWI